MMSTKLLLLVPVNVLL